MTKLTMSLLLLFYCGSKALCQIDPDLDEAFQIILDLDREKYQYGGISAALIYPDGCTWSGTSGIAGEDDTLTTETMFQSGLSTQIFTATLILMLQEEGKLSIEDAIGSHLDPIPNVDSAITIKQLLNHSSGIEYLGGDIGIIGLLRDAPDRFWTPDTLLSIISTPFSEPGQGFYFSEANYILLGVLIEKITGNSYAHELRTRIIDELELKRTFLPPYEDVVGDLALGVDYSTRKIYDGDHTALFSFIWASAAIVSTPTDILHFEKALLDGALISENSLKMLMDTINIQGLFGEWQGMGLGIGFLEYETVKFYGQTGFVLHRTRAYYSPEHKIGLTTFVTALSRTDAFYTLVNTIIESLSICDVTAVQNLIVKPKITVYPNPSDEEIRFSMDDHITSKYSLKVFNQLGQLVLDAPKVLGPYNLMRKDLGPGQFFVQIILDDNNYTRWVEKISFF